MGAGGSLAQSGVRYDWRYDWRDTVEVEMTCEPMNT